MVLELALELASLEKKKKKKIRRKKKKKKENENHLLSFCTAELKSEDIFVLRRVRAFRTGIAPS